METDPKHDDIKRLAKSKDIEKEHQKDLERKGENTVKGGTNSIKVIESRFFEVCDKEMRAQRTQKIGANIIIMDQLSDGLVFTHFDDNQFGCTSKCCINPVNVLNPSVFSVINWLFKIDQKFCLAPLEKKFFCK
jgi:hypothetical protein